MLTILSFFFLFFFYDSDHECVVSVDPLFLILFVFSFIVLCFN